MVLLGLSYGNADSQGCSDAGFCTMGAMRPDQTFSRRINFKLRTLEITQYRGATTGSPMVYATSVDFNFGISSKTSFQFKLPYQWVKGNLGSTSGLSDISVGLTTKLFENEKITVNGTLGGRIPTNSSNTTDNNERVLPMYYQTSLGSYDMVLGASLITREWLIATGLQMALSKNENTFNYDAWSGYSDQTYLRSNAIASELKRGADVMMRIERNFRFANFNIAAGMLPIFRLKRDRILNTETQEHISQYKTRGLALTAILSCGYHFNVRNSIKFLVGRKLKQRELNPDGLTRHQVMTFSYVTRF